MKHSPGNSRDSLFPCRHIHCMERYRDESLINERIVVRVIDLEQGNPHYSADKNVSVLVVPIPEI